MCAVARPVARIGDRFGARVTATYGRHSALEDDDGVLWSAVRRGRRSDVVVGDRVSATPAGPGQAAIESIDPRGTLLYRADAFRTKELAANVDQVVIVFASRPTFNQWFLWKALLAARAAGIDALVVRNKVDLDEGAAAAQATLDEIAALGLRTASVSARAQPEQAIEVLRPLLRGRQSLLVGESGMGKSTLLNLLVPDAQARTREFSERLDGGRQTTTAARWFGLPDGGALVDTPGFSEFGLAHVDASSLMDGFPDFAPYLGRCRFLDCRHLAEPDCTVRSAVAAGDIAPARYEFYRHLVQQAAR
jgi:ribosome biogenesis GTPase